MRYKIVVDSCCELPAGCLDHPYIERVPLAIDVGDYHIMDDETFDQAEFLKRVQATDEVPRSACPSPDVFKRTYETDACGVFVVTLSSHLSGSYNSALLGKRLYEEEGGEKDIYICDSESACGGETQYVLRILALAERGLDFKSIVSDIEEFRKSMHTWFVLDSLEHLRKNGRLSNWQAFVASTLNIKPVCAGDRGVIVKKANAMGMRQALTKMVSLVAANVEGPTERTLIISNCNCPERARKVREMILSKVPFGECMILSTTGIGSLYSQDGGIVVTY